MPPPPEPFISRVPISSEGWSLPVTCLNTDSGVGPSARVNDVNPSVEISAADETIRKLSLGLFIHPSCGHFKNHSASSSRLLAIVFRLSPTVVSLAFLL